MDLIPQIEVPQNNSPSWEVGLPLGDTVYHKDDFTFLIEAFLKHAIDKSDSSFTKYHYDELMEIWKQW